MTLQAQNYGEGCPLISPQNVEVQVVAQAILSPLQTGLVALGLPQPFQNHHQVVPDL